MKNITLYLMLIMLTLALASCSDKPIEEEIIPCENECLFVMEDVNASIVFMDCFQKYAIKTHSLESDTIIIYGIPPSIGEAFQEEGKEVTFTATFRENTLTPSFPDPNISMESLYEVDLISIE